MCVYFVIGNLLHYVAANTSGKNIQNIAKILLSKGINLNQEIDYFGESRNVLGVRKKYLLESNKDAKNDYVVKMIECIQSCHKNQSESHCASSCITNESNIPFHVACKSAGEHSDFKSTVQSSNSPIKNDKP